MQKKLKITLKYFYVIKFVLIILSNLFECKKNLKKIENLFLDTEGLNDQLTPLKLI